jgi:hypothetical protein
MVSVGASSWNPSAGLSVSNSYAAANTSNSIPSGLTVDLYYTCVDTFTEQTFIHHAYNSTEGTYVSASTSPSGFEFGLSADSYHSAYHSSYPSWSKTLSRLAS